MKDYLKVYKATLHTLSPVFVGSGKELSKKEYLLDLNDGRIIVYDPGKLYILMKSLSRSKQFEEFLLNDRDSSLYNWIRDNGISTKQLESAVRYSIDCGERLQLGGGKTQVMEFAKDPYGLPYVPGSGIKGMLRTILLASEIMDNRNAYEKEAQSIRNNRQKKRSAMSRESNDVEVEAFNTLDRSVDKKVIKKSNAVNDILQKIIISDSKPLLLDDLVLCQKIDRHIDGSERSLPLMRECLKPGVDIEFTITIDTQDCKYDDAVIMDCISRFVQMYQTDFLGKFKLSPINTDTVFLGGGVGFVSKTFIYPMFPGDEGVKVASKVFEDTLPEKVYYMHKHQNDIRNGLSPHVLKCTRYQGNLYQMGACRFSMEQIN